MVSDPVDGSSSSARLGSPCSIAERIWVTDMGGPQVRVHLDSASDLEVETRETCVFNYRSSSITTLRIVFSFVSGSGT